MEDTSRRQRIIRQTTPVYGMGLIGALIYFIQHANNFWTGILGILEAIVWPAIVVYKLLDFLKM